MAITTRSTHACFGGTQGFYTHTSTTNACDMRFAVYMPPQAQQGPVPALYYLSGLTCTEENFTIKAGAQRVASQLGLALVVCDTSPRGLNLPGDSESWDFGVGAGYYLDATQEPWAKHYRMGSYVNGELIEMIEAHFNVRKDIRGLFGHSMGGHGALISALRHPGLWHSLSVLAPIAHATAVPRRQQLFTRFLGPDAESWKQWDACELLKSRGPYPGHILCDQGLADEFIESLMPDALEATAKQVGQSLTMRRHAGYDHGYYFVQSFVEDHLRHHAAVLCA